MTYNKKSISINESPLLFSDYLYDFEKVSSYFSWHPEKDLKVCLEKRLQNYQLRKEIPEILNHRVRTAKIVGYTFHVNTWNATTTHLFKMRMETDIVEDIPVFVEKNI